MSFAPMRPVDAVAIEHEGKEKILIRDPERLCSEAMVVPTPLFYVATLFDGQRDAKKIQEVIAAASNGETLPLDFIETAATEFDRYFLLDNERSATERARLSAEFDAMPTRPAAHAGETYPDAPEQLRAMLDGFYKDLEAAPPGDPPRALITPHIDLRVGGGAYARTFSRLPAGDPADLYIVLGVAHQPARNLFTVTSKDFETPLGSVETDREAVDTLCKLYGANRLGGQYVHQYEHSIEFQCVFLKGHHGDAPFKILPILCGSMHEAWASGASGEARAAIPAAGEFIEALKTLIDVYNGRVCVVAGVDLSHVGLKFGDNQGLNPMRARMVELADRRMLDNVLGRDPEGFMEHFREDGNARNVDAVAAVYVMLHALGPGAPGELTAYRQWDEKETDSMVTFAGAAFY